MFRCLAVTDLCVGLISQPLYVTALLARKAAVVKINIDPLDYSIRVNYAASFILCGVSVLSSTAISVDRLLALLLGLRYRQVVTLKRVRVATMCFWLDGISCGTYSFRRIRISYIAGTVFTMLALIISVFSYIKIFLKLRHQQLQAQIHAHQGQLNGEGIINH